MCGSENNVAQYFSRPSVYTNELTQIVSGVYIDVFDSRALAKKQTNDFRTPLINEYLNGVQEVAIGNEKLLCGKSIVYLFYLRIFALLFSASSMTYAILTENLQKR